MSAAPTDTSSWKPFGTTGLRVPTIAVGCAQLGDMPEAFGYGVPEADALATVRTTLDSTIPYLDTAALYGDGESERRVGLVLRERGGLPDHAILQTKAGRDPKNDDFSGEMLKRRFERSLSLLGLDRVAIIYLHDPEHTRFADAMAPGGPVEVLRNYQEQGVIGTLGVAGGPIGLEIRYVETGLFDAVITHNRYTLINRSADPLLTLAAAKGMAVLNAAPYGSGILAKGPDAYPRYAYQQADSSMLDRVRRFQAVGDRHGVSLPAMALQFSTRDPRITTTIVGMSHPKRLQQTLDLFAVPIPDALWDEIAEIPFDADDPEASRFQRVEE